MAQKIVAAYSRQEDKKMKYYDVKSAALMLLREIRLREDLPKELRDKAIAIVELSESSNTIDNSSG